MTFRVICELTNRQEGCPHFDAGDKSDPRLTLTAIFCTPGADSGTLVSGSEANLHITSTDLDKMGWVKAGQEYEVEIRPVKS